MKSELITRAGIKEESFITRNHPAEGDFVTVRLTVPAEETTVSDVEAEARRKAEAERLEAEKRAGQERLAEEQRKAEEARLAAEKAEAEGRPNSNRRQHSKIPSLPILRRKQKPQPIIICPCGRTCCVG